MLLKVQSGVLSDIDDTLVKVYAKPDRAHANDLRQQARRQLGAMQYRLAELRQCTVHIERLLGAGQPQSLGSNRELSTRAYVDATQLGCLFSLVQEPLQRNAIS